MAWVVDYNSVEYESLIYQQVGSTWKLITTSLVVTETNPVITYGNGIGIVSNTYEGPWAVTTDGFHTFQDIKLPSQLDDLSSGVQFVNGQFILFGENLLLATSTDASSWDIVPNGLPCYASTGLVSYQNNTFVVGMEGSNLTGPVYTSSDGINWSILTYIPNLVALYYSNYLDAYVATTYSEIMYGDSLEGKWNMVNPPGDGGYYPIAGNGIWVYTENQRHNFVYVIGSIIVSSDLKGSSWSTTWQYQATEVDVVTSPVFVNSMFYVGDMYTSQLLQSPNATVWDTVDFPFDCESLFDLQAAGDMIFVGCNVENTPYYQVLKNNQWIPIKYAFDSILFINLLSNGVFVAIDYNEDIWTSKDAVIWQQMVGPQSQVFETSSYSMVYVNDGKYGLLGGNCDFWTADV